MGRGKERQKRNSLISWSEMMTPSGYPQDATNQQVETNNIFSFTDDLDATFDSHTLNGNNGVNRYRYQVSLELPRALAQCRYPKPQTM